MSSANKNLSEFHTNELPEIQDKKFAILVSEWNEEVTNALYTGAYETLIKHGAQEKNIISQTVPGSFELTLGAQKMAQKTEVDAVICLGCVIQGETKHFDFVCQGTTDGLMKVMLEYNSPISFCVLTDNTLQQSIDRSGGIHGNKGVECAVALLKMIALKKSFDL
jgi:6,7-dimethyl-8-ribityllumazine synthase